MKDTQQTWFNLWIGKISWSRKWQPSPGQQRHDLSSHWQWLPGNPASWEAESWCTWRTVMLRLMTACIHGGTCGLGMMPPLCQLDHWTGAHRGSRGKWGHRGKWGTPVLTAIPLKVGSTGQEKKELDHPKERQNYSNTPGRKLGGSVQASFSMSQAKQRFCYERLPRGTRGNLLAPFVLHCIGCSVDKRVT